MTNHFYFTSAEAAARLGLTTASLAVYRCQGVGPPFLKISERGRGAILYRRPDLDEWTQNRRRKKRAPGQRIGRKAALVGEG